MVRSSDKVGELNARVRIAHTWSGSVWVRLIDAEKVFVILDTLTRIESKGRRAEMPCQDPGSPAGGA